MKQHSSIKKIALFLFVIVHCILAEDNNTFARADIEKKWLVRKISFNGNMAIASSDLKQQCFLAPGFLSKTTLSQSKLENDLYALAMYYGDRGYLHCRINVDSIQYDSSKGEVDIFLKIDEKEPTRIDSVTCNGGLLFSDSLMAILSTQVSQSQILDMSNIEEAKKKLLAFMHKKGALEAKIEYSIGYSTDSMRVSLKYQVSGPERIVVDSISCTGLKKVAPEVVYRELFFHKGDTLTQAGVDRSINNLYSTGLFQAVAFATNPYLSINQKSEAIRRRIVVITVEEKSYFSVETGIGFHSEEKIRLSGRMGYDNFFGTGYKAWLASKVSFTLQSVEAGGSIPWILSVPVLFISSGEFRRIQEKSYEGMFLEGRAGFSYSFSPAVRLLLQDRLSRNIGKPIDTTTRKRDVHSILFGVTIDTRDDFSSPHRGNYTKLELEVAGITGANTHRFVKTQYDFRIYRPMDYSLVACSAVRAGIAYSFDPSMEYLIPITERFFVGGSNLLRGFEEKMAGDTMMNSEGKPVPAGGNAYLVINILELRFPIYKQRLEGACFFDAGNVWNQASRSYFDAANLLLNRRSFRYAAGCGVRLRLPIGLVRLDVAAKLDQPRPWEDRLAVHIDMGHSF